MINFKKACLVATVGFMLAPVAAFAASHQEMYDAVRDARGNVVVNTFGNCVITKWESSNGGCVDGKHDINDRISKELRTVYFDFNKSTLNTKEKGKLDELTKVIKASKEVESVDIVGFADMIGNDSYNKKLSTKRAQTVKSFLAAKGLKTRNVRVEGMGEAKSVTKCDSKMDRKDLIACLAADRRVEVKLNVKK